MSLLKDFTDRCSIFVVTGAFGSGKTEFSIALAKWLCQSKNKVYLIDLDIVNPYFRSRHRTQALEKEAGLTVISSGKGMENADVPALDSRIYPLVQSDHPLVIDVGGDADGAIALGQFREDLNLKKTCLIHVFNPNRPYADSKEKIKFLKDQIENICGLSTSLLIANPNLNLHTTKETVAEELEFIQTVQKFLKLPVILMTQKETLPQNCNLQSFIFERTMKLPFESGAMRAI